MLWAAAMQGPLGRPECACRTRAREISILPSTHTGKRPCRCRRAGCGGRGIVLAVSWSWAESLCPACGSQAPSPLHPQPVSEEGTAESGPHFRLQV